MPDTKITRAIVHLFQEALRTATADLARTAGLTIDVEGGSFDADEARLRVVIRTPRAAKLDALVAGVPEGVVGKTFMFHGKEYRVLEIHASRPKYPITGARIPDGKRFKFPRTVLEG